MLFFVIAGTLPGSRKEVAFLFHAFFSLLREDDKLKYWVIQIKHLF